jgi:hypothetical protein
LLPTISLDRQSLLREVRASAPTGSDAPSMGY